MEHVFDQRRYLIPFRSSLLPHIFTDTLVIGSGVAGMRAAIAAAGHGEVILLSKAPLKSSNTAWAQGGIAAATGAGDTVDAHVRDTMAAGAGLCDASAVQRVADGAAERIAEIVSWGMRLDRGADGDVHRGREGGHSQARILHADGDATGRELARALLSKLAATPGVRIFEGCFALDLVTPTREVGSPVMGAVTHHPRYGLQIIWAKATILATGGAGVLYRETTNPPQATGDGLACAFRAGAVLQDMAFVQFHPTTLYLPGAHRALISEAVRGEGAVLLDASHHRFMPDAHVLADLAPRDVVSRAIVDRIARQGGRHVWLDCRGVNDFAVRFPGIAKALKQFDLDASMDLIPVHPAAHYAIGGVRTDLEGRTDVPGLYAVGEVASTGLHGANRLASNSLLEGLVMGEIVGRICAEMQRASNAWGMPARPGPAKVNSDIPLSEHGELDLDDVRSSLRSAMWRNVGIERTGAKLNDARDMFDFWARYTLDKIFDDPEGWEVQNMLLTGAVVARSAAWRQESRGCHSRDDFPGPEEAFAVHDGWRRGSEEPLVRAVEAQAREAAA